MENHNLVVKARMEAAVGAGDWATVQDCMAPDFVLHEPTAFPFGGDYRGVPGMQELHRVSPAFLKGERVTHLQPMIGANPDNIAFHIRLEGKVVATGASFDSTILEFIEFKDGKLVSARPHWFNPPVWS